MLMSFNKLQNDTRKKGKLAIIIYFISKLRLVNINDFTEKRYFSKP